MHIEMNIQIKRLHSVFIGRHLTAATSIIGSIISTPRNSIFVVIDLQNKWYIRYECCDFTNALVDYEHSKL